MDDRKSTKSLEFVAYTDGSCDNLSPYGEGGAGYIILSDGCIIHEAKKGFLDTTNNRMEMLAIISAVNFCPKGSTLTIHTDSKYCINAFETGRGSANRDLIEMYQNFAKNLKSVKFEWVKGHSDNEYNTLADRLAFSAYAEMVETYGLPTKGLEVGKRKRGLK